jgi:predicted TIM-barrel fold metal-dependent hydrolase
MPGMAAWVAPTFDVEELDKRINDLKSVQFWLEQNARALAATIQALEVQKMTLATLKNMDMGLDDAVKAMQANPADLWRSWQTGSGNAKTASTAAPEPAAAQESTTQKAAPVDPMQWWGALSEQFQTIAQNAANEIAKASEQAEKMMATVAQPAAQKAGSTKKASKTTKASRAKVKPKATAAKKATGRTRKPAA